MIDISRKDARVNVEIKIYIPTIGNRIYPFWFSCETDEYAGLLASQMRDVLAGILESIRANAYTEGYRDGRSKLKKKTSFSRNW